MRVCVCCRNAVVECRHPSPSSGCRCVGDSLWISSPPSGCGARRPPYPDTLKNCSDWVLLITSRTGIWRFGFCATVDFGGWILVGSSLGFASWACWVSSVECQCHLLLLLLLGLLFWWGMLAGRCCRRPESWRHLLRKGQAPLCIRSWILQTQR